MAARGSVYAIAWCALISLIPAAAAAQSADQAAIIRTALRHVGDRLPQGAVIDSRSLTSFSDSVAGRSLLESVATAEGTSVQDGAQLSACAAKCTIRVPALKAIRCGRRPVADRFTVGEGCPALAAALALSVRHQPSHIRYSHDRSGMPIG
jgi:hypothetical protein